MSDALQRLQQASQAMAANALPTTKGNGSSYFHVRAHQVSFDQQMTQSIKGKKPEFADRVYKVLGEKIDLLGRPTGEAVTAYITPRGLQAVPATGEVFEAQNNKNVNGAYWVEYYQLYAADQQRMVCMAKPGNPRENANGDVVASVFAVDPAATVSVPMSSLLDGSLTQHIMKMQTPWKNGQGQPNRVFNDADGKPVFDPDKPRYGVTPFVVVRFMDEEIQLWGKNVTKDRETGEFRWASEKEIEAGWQATPRQQAVYNRLFVEWPEKLRSMGITKEELDKTGVQIHATPGVAAQVGKRALNGYQQSHMPGFAHQYYKVGDSGRQVSFSVRGADGKQQDVVQDVPVNGYNWTEFRLTEAQNGNWVVDKLKPHPFPGKSEISAPIAGVPMSRAQREERRVLAAAQQGQQQAAPVQQQPHAPASAAAQTAQQSTSAPQQQTAPAPQHAQPQAAPVPQQQYQQPEHAPVAQQQAAPEPVVQQQKTAAAYDPYGEYSEPSRPEPTPPMPAHMLEEAPFTEEDLISLQNIEMAMDGVEFDETPYQPPQQAAQLYQEQEEAPRKRPSGLSM